MLSKQKTVYDTRLPGAVCTENERQWLDRDRLSFSKCFEVAEKESLQHVISITFSLLLKAVIQNIAQGGVRPHDSCVSSEDAAEDGARERCQCSTAFLLPFKQRNTLKEQVVELMLKFHRRDADLDIAENRGVNPGMFSNPGEPEELQF